MVTVVVVVASWWLPTPTLQVGKHTRAGEKKSQKKKHHIFIIQRKVMLFD